MASIEKLALPADALLARYIRPNYYTDCYSTVIAADVSHADFVNAFYTTCLFRLERFILTFAVKKPSTDADVASLANGTASRFAAWTVEARAENQLLLCDFRGRTRSWLMIAPESEYEISGTRLYFGSAVVPVRDDESDAESVGWAFTALLGFHKLYSRALLYSARVRLARSR